MDKNDQNQRPVESVSSNGAESPIERTQIPKPLSASDLSGQDRIDYELMQRVAINHENAVGELYDRFGSLVFRMAYQSMPTRSEAEDAVQEIFVRLWRTARAKPRWSLGSCF